MALGAADDPELAYRYGEVTAREGQRAVANWALAPMADLNLRPLSSNVGTRAFGDRASHVLPLLKSFCRGLRDQDMADCIKTFPGNGSDYRDQHLATTLAGHYQQSAQRADGLQRIGHQQCFRHRGVRSHGDLTESAVKAFACGMDMALWPSERFVDCFSEKLLSGPIPMSRLEDALDRIWRLKARYATIFRGHGEEASECARSVAAETAAKSLTLLWNRGAKLPLRPVPQRRLLLLGITPYDQTYARFSILSDELERRGLVVARHRYLTPEGLAAFGDE